MLASIATVRVSSPISNGGVSLALHLRHYELSLVLLILVILTRVIWNFKVALICISLTSH